MKLIAVILILIAPLAFAETHIDAKFKFPLEKQKQIQKIEKENITNNKTGKFTEIELKDEENKPIPHGPYEFSSENGQIKEGGLDSDGIGHMSGPEPGDCEIYFPDSDYDTWERE